MRKFLSLIAVLVLYTSVFAQIKLTTGRITDQQGQPVPFVTIRIKGTKTGTSADADGSFSIRAKAGDVLIVSGPGLAPKEVNVPGTGNVMIQVSRKESNLTELYQADNSLFLIKFI